MEERIGAVRSKWMGVATNSVVNANVMVLIPVLERQANICAKVSEICPSPLTESNLKKKFYKHKILFFKFSLRYHVNQV